VTDDGIGGADPTIGSGLTGLSDRVESADGRLPIISERGSGTTVRVMLPQPGGVDARQIVDLGTWGTVV
jgi:signal transduction histidine kinase